MKTRDRLYFSYGEMINVGIDEAGRGPLAGPVWVGAAVILDESVDLSAFGDSKLLTEKRRESAYQLIQDYVREGKLLVSSSYSRASTIDRLGIIPAQAQAMRRTVTRIMEQKDEMEHIDKIEQIDQSISSNSSTSSTFSLLIDGNHTFGLDRDYDVQTIIHGDSLIPEISIASILAKVERDRYMVRQGKKYPAYGLEQHKGYGTAQHREMIKKHGLSTIHRVSFCKNIF